jgi:hypothetical protein
MTMARTLCRWWLAAAFAATVCGDDPADGELDALDPSEPAPEPDVRSTYLDVFLDSDARICGPTLERLDAEVERLAEALGVIPNPEQPIVLHYGGDWAVKERCDIELEVGELMWGGCTQGAGLWNTAQPGAESHELVHALRVREGLVGPPYWEEGLATYYGTWRPYAGFRVWASGDLEPSKSLPTFRGPRYCLQTQPDTTLTVIARGSAEHGAVHARTIASDACPAHEPNPGTNVVPGTSHEFETRGCEWSVAYVSSLEGDQYEIELFVR